MRKSQTIALELSEVRQQINKDPDAENAPELRARSLSLETDWREAVRREEREDAEAQAEHANGANGDGEPAELRALVSGVRCGAYLSAVASGGQIEGREQELNQHLGLTGNTVPWEALAPIEQRADATTAPPSGSNIPQQSILERVFARSDTAFLGVAMPSVGVGEPSYPVFSAGATAEQLDTGASGKDIEAATITATSVSPKRIQARYRLSAEGAATFPGLESALRSDLTNALQESFDKRMVADNLLGASGLTNPTDPTAKVAWQTGWNSLVELVDGRYSYSVDELRMVVGAKSYQTFETLYLGAVANRQTEVSLNDKLMSRLGGYRVSAHVPAPASDIQPSIVALGSHRACVAPIWQGVRLIRDEVTRANEAEVVVTAVMLAGFLMLRQDAMKRIEFKLA